ncbi:MAG: tetratricopeptide repeat protein [Candidatus Hydrogenedentota bacterium]
MKITEISSPDEEYVNQGLKSFLLYKFDDALNLLIKAIDCNPYNYRAHLYRGHTFLLKSLPVEALIEYRKAGKIKNGEYLPLFYQALAYFKRKKYDNTFNLLITINPEFLNEEKDIEEKLFAGKNIKDSYNEILGISENNVKSDITFIERNLKKVQEYIEYKWYNKAFTTIEGLKRVEPSNSDIYYFSGFILFKKRRDNEAEKEFLKAIAINPEMKDAKRSLAVLYARKGYIEKALHIFKEILKRYPNDRLTLNYFDELVNRPS